MPSGITVQCVSRGCKKKRLLSYTEAAALDGPPMCDCGMPMVAIQARISSRRSRSDIRQTMSRVGGRSGKTPSSAS